MPGLQKRSMSQITGKTPMKPKKKKKGTGAIKANRSAVGQKFQTVRG